MAYDGKVMREALQRFEEDKQRRASQAAARRQRIYREVPRLEEIEQQLRMMAGTDAVKLTFVPHLLPTIRGIHSTIYIRLKNPDTELDLQALYENRYKDEYFVDVMPAGSTPETRSVRGSNFLRLAVHRPGNGELIIVLAVEDNLVKGAAGQSVQAMNILFGLDERTGLDAPALVP